MSSRLVRVDSLALSIKRAQNDDLMTFDTRSVRSIVHLAILIRAIVPDPRRIRSGCNACITNQREYTDIARVLKSFSYRLNHHPFSTCAAYFLAELWYAYLDESRWIESVAS